jgi:hypothetical protein
MSGTLPTLLVLLGALAANLAFLVGGSGSGCAPNPPRRPGSR